MNAFHRSLQDLSHSASGLKKSCAFILLMGMAAAGVTGTALGFLESRSPPKTDLITDIYTRFQLYQSLHLDRHPEMGLTNPDTPSLGMLFIGPPEQWLPELLQESKTPNPKPGSQFALGLYWQSSGDFAEAIDLFHRENQAYPHELVRYLELQAALRARDLDTIARLRQDPAYTDEADARFMYHVGIKLKNWPMILKNFWAAEYRNLRVELVLLTLIAGAIWTGLLLSLFPGKSPRIYFFMVPLALALGWISTWPTVWSGIWLEDRFQLHEGGDFFASLLYFLVSVGLREEVCKLLLFTPLLFRVAKSGRDLEALIFGGLVGLGFAIEENMSYFQSYQGSGVIVSRFVSANLLHLSLTALTSLALTRAWREPGKWGAEAVQVLAMAIGIHGLYNTLLSQPIPGLGDMSYFSGSMLALCAYLLFREVQPLSPLRGTRISRSAIFCWGFCLLFNLELLSAVLNLPFQDALYITGQAAISAAFIGYVFLHQVQEPLGL